MLSVWCLVPGNYPTARRLRPLRSLIEDRTIAEKSIDLILSRYLGLSNGQAVRKREMIFIHIWGQNHEDDSLGKMIGLDTRSAH